MFCEGEGSGAIGERKKEVVHWGNFIYASDL